MKYLKAHITAVVLILILLAAVARGFFYASVCVVTGTIQYHGKLVERGLPVTAHIGQDKVAEGITEENGAYELRIPEYDPARPEVKGYRSPDDVVQVRLDGKIAKPTFSPSSENLAVNLQVETTLDIKLSTWGKIKALFK